MIDILKVEPHKVKAGFQGKTVLLFGEPKVGKTTLASKFPKPLLLATEIGYNMIDGIKAVPINNWIDLKSCVKQLAKEEAKNLYETVIVDTADLAWALCEKYIKTQNDIEDLSELPFGRAYKLARQEFQDTIDNLTKCGYTIVFISHAEKKDYVNSIGNTISGITPTLDKRPKEYIMGLVDLVMYAGYITDENGRNKAVAYLRGGKYGDNYIEAGGRFGEGLPQVIPFDYESFSKAIDKCYEAMSKSGVKFSSSVKTVMEEIGEQEKDAVKRDFGEVYGEAQSLLEVIKERNDKDLIVKAKEIIDDYMGKGHKISEAKPGQEDLLEACIAELKKMI